MATVTVAQGKLRGSETTTANGYKYYEFLEIPYAQPPVGNLRFQLPQSALPWKGERDATTFHPERVACQLHLLDHQLIGTEDCLYLNVFTPKVKPTSALPVMVYIHGGGFVGGNGTQKTDFGPDFLIENDVIIVSINYRLDIFGFLSLNIPEAAGNMGLKDQVKALQWVKDNITHFGGDSNNITIFGISAGSASVEYLMLSPLAKGLFHKAILLSGSALNDWAINFDHDKLLQQLLKLLNYSGPDYDNRAIYEYLLNIPMSDLALAAAKTCQGFTSNRLFFGFVPTVEKEFGNGTTFLSELPYKLLKEGRINKVPVIRGFCADEGFLMIAVRPLALKELQERKDFTGHWSYEFDSFSKETYNKKLSAAYLENMEQQDDPDKFALNFFGDLHFSAGVTLSGKLTCGFNVPTFMYKFSYVGNLNLITNMLQLTRKGAAHADDVSYFIRINSMDNKIPNDIDILVRKRITKMWTNFAKTGNPTPHMSEEVFCEWPIYTNESPVYLNIDKDLTVNWNSPVDNKKMEVFAEIYEKYEK